MATQPINYVLAFKNDGHIKDVTPRYCEQWNTITRKSHVPDDWWQETLRPYRGAASPLDRAEDRYFKDIHEKKPMPTAISDFKNHPLYALRRHLLKYEDLYPPDAPAIGWIRGEPVYARECVHTLQSREMWFKEARVVKMGEEPYKIVKARPKWDRYTHSIVDGGLADLFGYWQTEEYDPPTAEDGIVPRNAYGNVELWKIEMLPKKTVHIQLPNLNKVCKKLNIDCVPAMVGFDGYADRCRPAFDGFVVCEEFAELVTATWAEEQEEISRKGQEKREKRVYGNWRRLIRGLMIRARLKVKYNFGAEEEDEMEKQGASAEEPSTSKSRPRRLKKKKEEQGASAEEPATSMSRSLRSKKKKEEQGAAAEELSTSMSRPRRSKKKKEEQGASAEEQGASAEELATSKSRPRRSKKKN